MASITPPLIVDGSTLAIPRASTTQDGYLSHNDFILFSGGTLLPVTSFNMRTGEVVLLEDDVLAALGYMPLNKAGDTMTGPLILPGGPPTNSLQAITKAYAESLAGGGTTAPGIYLASDFNASGSLQKFTGSISGGSTSLTLTAASDFVVGQGILIKGAGASSAGIPGALLTKVDAIDATLKIVTLHNAAPSTVTAVAGNVQHDDTVAIQAAIDACFAAGGGEVQFTRGFYRVNGPVRGDTNSLLRIPYVPWTPPTPPVSIALRGVGGYFHFGPQNGPISTVGPAIQTDVRNAAASILAGNLWADYGGSGTYTAGSQITLRIQDLAFHTYNNPEISGIDCGMIWNAILKNVTVDAGMGWLGPPATAQPTHGTFALRLPQCNFSTFQFLEDVCLQSYHIGLIMSELMTCTSGHIFACNIGVQIAIGFHLNTGQFFIDACPTGIVFNGRSPVEFTLSYEAWPSSFWYFPISGRYIYDPSNVAIGRIRWFNCDAGTTVSAPITTTGLTRVTLVPIDKQFA